jgi:hypothetical protein
MNVSRKVLMALGFFLTVPVLAIPALGAPAPAAIRNPEHRQMFNFANAQAFVTSAAAPILRAKEIDGLGREDEECNVGCVDH